VCSRSIRRYIDQIAHRAGAIPSISDFYRESSSDYVPGCRAPIVVNNGESLIIIDKIWGYDICEKLVYNARSETFQSKQSFKDNMPCGVLVAGFYEGGQLFTSIDNVLYMAGLCKNQSFVVLTQDSKDTKISSYYHRAPILLDLKTTLPVWLASKTLPNLKDKQLLQAHENLYKVA